MWLMHLTLLALCIRPDQVKAMGKTCAEEVREFLQHVKRVALEQQSHPSESEVVDVTTSVLLH